MTLNNYTPGPDKFFVWDGRQAQPLRLESEANHLYVPDMSRIMYMVVKAGSETVVHRGNKA